MKYLSNEFMLDLLAKIQPLQIEILKTGRSAHVDAVYAERFAPHINLDVSIFEVNELVKHFEFYGNDTEEVANATLALLIAYIHSF